MRSIKFYLPLLLCLLLLAGCGKDKQPTKDSDSQTEAPPEVARELLLIENGICSFEIVYPTDADASIVYAANYLRDAFLEATGIQLEVVGDFLRDGETHEADRNKILIGETNYTESAEVMRKLRYYDYGVKIAGDKLVIAGRNSEDLCQAVDWLAENVLAGYTANGSITVRSEYEYHYEDYTVQSIKVGDTELKDFRFVYADDQELTYVTDLRDSLAHTYGYQLPIVRDTAGVPEAHEIVIGNTSREASRMVPAQNWLTYTAAEHNGSLAVRTGGLCSTQHALKGFLSLFEEGTEGEYRFAAGASVTRDLYDDPNNTRQWAAGSELRIMDMNILAQDYAVDWVDDNGIAYHYESIDFRKEIFYAQLDYYQPAIVGIQEMDTRCERALRAHPDYGTKYELLTKTDSLSTLGSRQYYTAILYRKDLLTLQEGSFDMQVYDVYAGKGGHRCRNMAWGTFTVKATGNSFVYFVTHWDVASREDAAVTAQSAQAVKKVNELIQQTGLPIFCMADWNSNERSPYINNFIKGTGLKNTKTSAIRLVNNVGSFHDYGYTNHSSLSCDHIFASQSVTVLQFQTLFYNQQIWASDHSWLMADVKF